MNLGKDFDLQIDRVIVQSRIEILGIVYSYELDSINSNFQKEVDKASNNIKCWYSRHLTLYGRVFLVKSLICSLLQYIGQVYVFPDKYINKNEDIKWKFVWHGKNWGRIKRLMLCKDFDNGGLKLVDVVSSLKSLKIMCLKRVGSKWRMNYFVCMVV